MNLMKTYFADLRSEMGLREGASPGFKPAVKN